MALREETSTYLDLLRLAAVLLVFFNHFKRPEFTGDFFHEIGVYRLGVYGQEGVAIFFVISGVIIAHAAATRDRSLRAYAVSRLSRLWSVVIPAVALTIVLDLAGSRFAPDLYAIEGLPPLWGLDWGSAWRAICPVLFLNSVPAFATEVGTNAPFWSLSYEAWYYAAFGIAFFLRGRRRAVALAAVALFAGPPILALAPIWLLGVGAHRLLGRGGPSALAWAGWLASAAAIPIWMVSKYAVLRLAQAHPALFPLDEAMGYGIVEKYVPAALLFVNIVCFDRIGSGFRRFLASLAGPLRFAVGRSFSIYLYQAPLFFFLGAVTSGMSSSPLRAACVGAGAVGLALVLAEFTERRRASVAGWLDAASAGFAAPALPDPDRGRPQRGVGVEAGALPAPRRSRARRGP